jgi:hypothetical protein
MSIAIIGSVARKIKETRNAIIEEYDFNDHEYKKIHMPNVDKAFVIGYCSLIAPVMFPFWVIRDIRDYEVTKQGVNTFKMQKKRVLDYYWS